MPSFPVGWGWRSRDVAGKTKQADSIWSIIWGLRSGNVAGKAKNDVGKFESVRGKRWRIQFWFARIFFAYLYLMQILLFLIRSLLCLPQRAEKKEQRCMERIAFYACRSAPKKRSIPHGTDSFLYLRRSAEAQLPCKRKLTYALGMLPRNKKTAFSIA